MKLKAHVFVCTNERPAGHPRGCCKEKGSEKLVELFKEALSKKGLKGEIRAQRSGCLDTCEFGPSVVVYPEGIWYSEVTPALLERIVVEHLKHGKPIDEAVFHHL